jgi:hypothetical protein
VRRFDSAVAISLRLEYAVWQVTSTFVVTGAQTCFCRKEKAGRLGGHVHGECVDIPRGSEEQGACVRGVLCALERAFIFLFQQLACGDARFRTWLCHGTPTETVSAALGHTGASGRKQRDGGTFAEGPEGVLAISRARRHFAYSLKDSR